MPRAFNEQMININDRMNQSLNMQRRAFTLVELLVVIAIIGLLSTVAVVSLSSARKQSRNTKRNADAKQLVTAFNMALNTGSVGQYPGTGGDVWVCISSVCTEGLAGYAVNATVDAFFTPFMPNKPADPVGGTSRGNGGYVYNGASAAVGNVPAIVYFLEPAAVCGVGYAYATTASYVECLVKLD